MPDQSVFQVSEKGAMAEARARLPKGIKVVDSPNQSLDKNSYLKLLLNELSKQDPMNPVNDKEFISQMAQFSALEQMNNVANSVNGLKNFQAGSLVGRQVSGRDMLQGKPLEGLVEKVIYDGSGEAILRVAGQSMRLKDIAAISEKIPEQPAAVEKKLQRINLPPAPVPESAQVAENVSRETKVRINLPARAAQEYNQNQAGEQPAAATEAQSLPAEPGLIKEN